MSKKILLNTIVCIVFSLFTARNTYAQKVGEFSYQVSFPMGEFKDFVGKTSWAGLSASGRVYLKGNERVSLGGRISWFYFPDKKGRQTVDVGDLGEGGVFTGNVTNFTNIFGLMGTAQYDLKSRKSPTVPFVRVGIGGAYQNQRRDIGLYEFEDDGIQFLLNGEAGVLFNRGSKGFFIAGTYHFLPEAGDVLSTSFLGVKIGVSSLSFR
jgi:hypothetical protein